MGKISPVEQIFIETVTRINRIFIIMGIFFFVYFLFQTHVDIFLFFLSLSYMAFALLSHRHSLITNKLYIELERAKIALSATSKETREMHPDK